MTVRNTSWRPLALLALSLSLSACSFAGDDGGSPKNRCAIDNDCVEGTCDTTLGMCVSPPDGPVTVVLEVRPDDRERPGTAVTQWVTPFQITDITTKDITLVAPITVIGNATTATGGNPVQVDVTLRKVTTTPGVPDVVVTTSSSTATAGPDTMPTAFGLTVGSAADYEMDVQPTGDAAAIYPPVHEVLTVPGDYAYFRRDITFAEVTPKVRGTLVDTEGHPQSNLRVRAYDAVTGRAISTQVVSGMGNVPGYFELAFRQTPSNYVIRVSGSSERPAFPTINIDPAYLLADDDDAVTVLVPNLPTTHFKGRVTLQNGDAVAGTTLTLTSTEVVDTVTGIKGSFSVMPPPSDAEGVVEMDVLPGTYEVVLSPQNTVDAGNLAKGARGKEDHSAVLAEQIVISTTGDKDRTYTFKLPDQVEVTGIVNLAAGSPMVGATLVATALSRLSPDSDNRAELYNRSLPAGSTTDDAGSFSVMMDRGSYDFVVQPPAGSGYPWLVRPGLVVPAPDGEPFSWVIPGATPVMGTVQSAKGSAVSGAEIRAWAVLNEGATTRAVQIGRAVTDDKGGYTLLLPSRF